MAAESLVAGIAADAGYAAQQPLSSATGKQTEYYPLQVYTDNNDT